MNIKQHAQQDPNSFYTERWADGYMVYHCGTRCFSYSITRAKNRLAKLGEEAKGLILIEYRTNVDRESEILERVETYSRPEFGSDLGFESFDNGETNREVQFTNIFPAQKDPKLFALRKRRLLFACPEYRLAYEMQFDVDIYVCEK